LSVVLDSSATLAWIYLAENCLAWSLTKGAWVPGIWRLDVAKVLEMGVRRGRTDADFRDAALGDLAALPIQVDPDTDRQAWSATIRLATTRALTLYDAACLELARRRGLPLATLDKELREAAVAEGVLLFGL